MEVSEEVSPHLLLPGSELTRANSERLKKFGQLPRRYGFSAPELRPWAVLPLCEPIANCGAWKAVCARRDEQVPEILKEHNADRLVILLAAGQPERRRTRCLWPPPPSRVRNGK